MSQDFVSSFSSVSSAVLTRTLSGTTSELITNANRIESTLTPEDANNILTQIFNGEQIMPDARESLCEITTQLESIFQSGGRGENINKQQIPHTVGAKQKVQVGGNTILLQKWLTRANVIFNSSYRTSTVEDDPVNIAFVNGGRNVDNDIYKKLKNLHIFLKLLILKTILQKTNIHVRYNDENKKLKKQLLERLCEQLDIYFGEFDIAAAMFIIFCGKTTLQQFGTLTVMTACGYSATYAPQICSLFFQVMTPGTNLVSCLFNLGLPTLIASVFTAKTIVNTVASYKESIEKPKFPRPEPPPKPWLERLKESVAYGFNFVTDMSPVTDVTLPRLSTLSKTMFAALVHIKNKATQSALNPVIHLFLDTFAGSDRIFQIANAKPEQFGNLLLGIIEAVDTVFPGDGEDIAHTIQSSRFSKIHASAETNATRRSSRAAPYGGGSTIKLHQHISKSSLKTKNVIKTMNKRNNNSFRYDFSKHNSRLYKNRHRGFTSKLSKKHKQY